MKRRFLAAVTVALAALVAGAIALGAAPAPAATGTIPYLWKNCTHVNAKYRHGVGRYGARDRTSGIPVRNFLHSTRISNIAMRYNRGLDRDKDGIACEKR